MIPCKDCITLAICKAEAIRRYEEKVIKHSLERLTDNVLLNLSIKCSLIYDYMQFQDAYNLNFAKESLMLGRPGQGMVKVMKEKMIEAKLFFNLPLGLGDGYVKSDM